MRQRISGIAGWCAALCCACATNFGDPGQFLPCDAEGQCAEGHTCAQTDVGAVCLTEEQFAERCGHAEACNGRDDDCDGATDEDFSTLGQPCDVGTGVCIATGTVVCAADGSTVCSAVPGAATDEACNGRDDDCDGATDEDLADVVTGTDEGACAPQIERCTDGTLVVIQERIVPTDEACNGADDDCDGATDEDLADVVSGTDEGECAVRIESCVAGVPTILQEGVVPTDEACNMLDDDCDGATDDAVPLIISGLAVGQCRLTVSECVNGAPLVTQSGVAPTDEVCNDRDDDCDGETDEDFALLGSACIVGVGACTAMGVYQCSEDGSAVACDAVAGSPSAELCDNLDNNCDGATDEPFAELGQPCSVGVGACRADGSLICRDDGFGTRCDAEPLAPTDESCDGEDNDCNGRIDDGLGDGCCIPSTSRDCGIALGTCTEGRQTCQPDRSWGACSGQGPTEETCDRLDNDCDGEVDDGAGCACTPGDFEPCSVTRGACVAGEQVCRSDSTWGACSGILPTPESCDGEDNDCDGQTDEDFPTLGQECDVGTGACARSGTILCSADRTRAECSEVPGVPADEACDGEDNDCDGEVDEGLVIITGSDTGECRQGIQRCVGGVYALVQEEVAPTDEVCNGLDDDCDGGVDEDAPECCAPGEARTCGITRGECRFGTQRCGPDRAWSECSGVLPVEERCDQRDNDCDGATDEQWVALVGNPCVAGLGVCARMGTYRCTADAVTAECDTVAGSPGTESCNGLDDDCDGLTDEVQDVPPVIEGSSVGRCRPRVSVCTGGEMVEVQSAVGPSEEICNGADDDCDTMTDNEVPSSACYEGPDGTAGVGVCFGGATACVSGRTVCAFQSLPFPEVCDGEDNDCDGVTDGSRDSDGNAVPLTDACYTGPDDTLNVGECRAGTTRCRQGAWTACVQDVVPAPETCGDEADTDCDGRPDGITFLEDFEDGCAMPEATVTSDVLLECVETPVDAGDPIRTPAGERSLRVALVRADQSVTVGLSWMFDTCAEDERGSLHVYLATPITGVAEVLMHPNYSHDRARLTFGQDITHVQVDRIGVGSNDTNLGFTLTPLVWHEISWVFTDGSRIEFSINGASVFAESLDTDTDGVSLRAVAVSEDASVDLLLDDVRFRNPL